jgi:hypothetical protein
LEKLEWSRYLLIPSTIFLTEMEKKHLFIKVLIVFNQTFKWEKTGGNLVEVCTLPGSKCLKDAWIISWNYSNKWVLVKKFGIG